MDVSGVVVKCPFLHGIKATQGEAAAETLVRKACPRFNGTMSGPIFEEDYALEKTFQVIHGDSGVAPLKPLIGCPFRACVKPDAKPEHNVRCGSSSVGAQDISVAGDSGVARVPIHAAPFASISVSGLFQGGEWPWNKPKRDGKRPHKPKPNSADKHAGRAHAQQPAMDKLLQPLTAMVISKAGHLQCPPPILAMRKWLAHSALCKALRPQELPFKLAACGVLSALANIPPGMAKEHFEKFSPGWIVAVHLSIPFVAALRKAVVMPKYALIVTIAGAIGGQLIGGMIERKRLLHREAQALAVLEGTRMPNDVPLFCALSKALLNPWDGEDSAAEQGVPAQPDARSADATAVVACRAPGIGQTWHGGPSGVSVAG